jgi:hypothetical protein
MQKISEDIKKVFESKLMVGIMYIIGIILILLVVFAAGMTVGFHRASFGIAWQKNYERNFGMMPEGMILGQRIIPEQNLYFPDAHGAAGKIIKITLPTVIVADKDNTEKTIFIGNGADIREQRKSLSPLDLKVGDFVVVIGNPNANGQIEAELIRVMPAPGLLSNNKTAPVPSNN